MTRRAPRPTCEVHGLPLRPGHAEVFYGLPEHSWFGAWMQAERTQFPHARVRRAGGCMVVPGNPTRDEVLFCPACREALARWDAAWAARETGPRSRTHRGPEQEESDAP